MPWKPICEKKKTFSKKKKILKSCYDLRSFFSGRFPEGLVPTPNTFHKRRDKLTVTHGRTDERTHGRTDGRTDERTDGRTNGRCQTEPKGSVKKSTE